MVRHLLIILCLFVAGCSFIYKGTFRAQAKPKDIKTPYGQFAGNAYYESYKVLRFGSRLTNEEMRWPL